MNAASPRGWLAAEGLPPGVHAGTTLRQAPGHSRPPFEQCNLGDRCGDDPAAVAANRAVLRDWLMLPGEVCWLRQVHGVTVHHCDSPPPVGSDPPQADAAVSNTEGGVLAVLTADCLPVVFASRAHSTIAIAHAGWRGLAAGVLEQTVAAMRCPPAEVCAWLGPAIGPASFEVGPEVREVFIAQDSAATNAFRPGRADRWFADLYALARLRLHRAGIEQISGGGLDTCADANRFYSYRRDQDRSGRMATLVWRDADGRQR
jgi:YfiH family protein